ncbi:Rv3654c family TadE-like protein [Corynebacterium pygosceleis]|uniref:Rv3654c family TadE-like protein n=1 Tax=Corynebacterium pygosceleis TaxID=2800406 RepID=UPI002005FABD|nr:flp pilus-assembly TadE/G-like family protein [Corynebacterium pygosceleis]
MEHGDRGETGSTTLIAAAVIAAFTALTLVMVHITAGVLDRHRAQVAADLASVAAATALWFGDDACSAAEKTAARNSGGDVLDCLIDGTDVTVRVGVRDATARSRAGPL